MTEQTAESVEQMLHDGLVRGDASIAATRPVLRHLLAADDGGLLSDETVARVRGMTYHLAEQLLLAQASAAEVRDVPGYVGERQEPLAQALFADTALLSHAHGLTIEAQAIDRLQARGGVDAVLTPLIQEMASADDGGTAALAMSVLAAQARFLQHQRRMELPLCELPGNLLHQALLALRAQATADDEPAAEIAEGELRAGYDEAAGRLGLIARLVLALGRESALALRIAHSGLSIFSTALALASRQERSLVLLSLAERQPARLALSLRAAGLDRRTAIEQLLWFHADASMAEGLETMPADRAAALLAGSQSAAAL
jgi:hypothetical protein